MTVTDKQAAAKLRKENAKLRKLLQEAEDAIPCYIDGRHDKLLDAIAKYLDSTRSMSG